MLLMSEVYEKEGMGLQYNYGQQAADAEYKRNLQMWKDTNFGAQRAEMEDAGLSVGLMYGNGGGQAASTAGGNASKSKRIGVANSSNAINASTDGKNKSRGGKHSRRHSGQLRKLSIPTNW